jgi:hypothetical protein
LGREGIRAKGERERERERERSSSPSALTTRLGDHTFSKKTQGGEQRGSMELTTWDIVWVETTIKQCHA